jgi:4-amino-4-deoxy-L-arabinose transferase-like glycosyltransferase
MNAGTLEERATVPASVLNESAGEALPRKPVYKSAYFWIFLFAVVYYVAMAFTMASVKSPWVDEGWIPSSPANWARTGSFGTPGLAPTGSWLVDELTGVNRYNYWQLPGAVLVQGCWYKLFGFSLFTMRSLGILFGLFALISWFVIVSRLSESRLAGSLAAALISIDYTYIWSAADGRMDMMCAALGAAGIACYLVLRERRLGRALWLASTLLALACFTHPNGLLSVMSLLFLLFYYDLKRLRLPDLATLTPWLALAALWGVYILQRPDLFLAQFAANAAARAGSRWVFFSHPLRALSGEALRYLFHYGFMPLWGGPVPKYVIGIPFLYWAGLAAAWFYAPVRRCRGLFALLCVTSIVLAVMTLFVGLKSANYLVYIVPLYASVFAVLIWKVHVRNIAVAPIAVVFAALLVGCQTGAEVYKVHRNTYANEYLPAVRFVRDRAGGGKTIVADSCFGIDLGFDRITDDARLGFYSGVRPDLIIQDIWYDRWWNFQFPVEEPELYRYVTHLLETQYRVVYEKGSIRVYERQGA